MQLCNVNYKDMHLTWWLHFKFSATKIQRSLNTLVEEKFVLFIIESKAETLGFFQHLELDIY